LIFTVLPPVQAADNLISVEHVNPKHQAEIRDGARVRSVVCNQQQRSAIAQPPDDHLGFVLVQGGWVRKCAIANVHFGNGVRNNQDSTLRERYFRQAS